MSFARSSNQNLNQNEALLNTAVNFLLGAARSAAPNKKFIAQISNAQNDKPLIPWRLAQS